MTWWKSRCFSGFVRHKNIIKKFAICKCSNDTILNRNGKCGKFWFFLFTSCDFLYLLYYFVVYLRIKNLILSFYVLILVRLVYKTCLTSFWLCPSEGYNAVLHSHPVKANPTWKTNLESLLKPNSDCWRCGYCYTYRAELQYAGIGECPGFNHGFFSAKYLLKKGNLYYLILYSVQNFCYFNIPIVCLLYIVSRMNRLGIWFINEIRNFDTARLKILVKVWNCTW